MVPREVRYVKTVALCHSSCTTNGWRTWCTVAGNHKPYGSRRAHPLLFTISLSLSLSPLPSSLSVASRSLQPRPRRLSPRGMHFTWHSAGFCSLLQVSLFLPLPFSLSLSLFHPSPPSQDTPGKGLAVHAFRAYVRGIGSRGNCRPRTKEPRSEFVMTVR